MTVKYLGKVFSTEDDAKNFRAGNIQLQTLDHFRKCEDSSRRDSSEAVSEIRQGDGGTWSFTPPGEDAITGKLVGPVRFTSNWHAELYVLCMCAGDLTAAPDEFKQLLALPPNNHTWGQWLLLFTNPEEFIRRFVEAAAVAGLEFLGRGLVEYYDPSQMNGRFGDDEVPFRKELTFKDDNEYRFVFSRTTDGASPIEIKMVDISDITLLTMIDQFNDGLRVTLDAVD